jgi:fructokinase
MPQVVSLGELLIDFVPTASGLSLVEAPAFIPAAGGAPAKVAVGLARLGVSSGFMGQVGDDAFGHFLAQTLRDNDVDTTALRFTAEARTALAFVSLKANGERDFLFYRHPSADMLYRPEAIDADYVRGAKVFHFGSLSLIGEPARSATSCAVRIAREADRLVSYDPNLRLPLWPDADAARAGIKLGWSQAHVIKVSEEGLFFLSGTDDLIKGARQLWHSDLRMLAITRGALGCVYVTTKFSGESPGFQVESVDTTGAGDAFTAGLLKGRIERPEAPGVEATMQQICRYANAAGALTTTRCGAIPALPTAQTVTTFLASQN